MPANEGMHEWCWRRLRSACCWPSARHWGAAVARREVNAHLEAGEVSRETLEAGTPRPDLTPAGADGAATMAAGGGARNRCRSRATWASGQAGHHERRCLSLRPRQESVAAARGSARADRVVGGLRARATCRPRAWDSPSRPSSRQPARSRARRHRRSRRSRWSGVSAVTVPTAGAVREDAPQGLRSALLAQPCLARRSSSALPGNNASYTATITPEASDAVTVDIAAGAAQDSAGTPSAAADQFSIVADSAGGRRDRACGAVAGRRGAPARVLVRVDSAVSAVDRVCHGDRLFRARPDGLPVGRGRQSSRTGTRRPRRRGARTAVQARAPSVDVSPTVGVADGCRGGTPGCPSRSLASTSCRCWLTTAAAAREQPAEAVFDEVRTVRVERRRGPEARGVPAPDPRQLSGAERYGSDSDTGVALAFSPSRWTMTAFVRRPVFATRCARWAFLPPLSWVIPNARRLDQGHRRSPLASFCAMLLMFRQVGMERWHRTQPES